MSDLVGQQWGNYRLTRLLGQGGFAEVYQGEHLRLKMFAAIKILHTHLSEDGTEAFQREAQVIAELIHPHIVRVLDFDVKEGTPFLVLDYAPNGSLRQRHPRSSRLPLSLVVQYVQQVASALQYAHDRKIIHRDVKPENMLLGLDNKVLLSDFGIATIAHSTSSMSTQASMGTIPYMAPEQIQSHPRPASDQYALAIVVYQWLSGELPFQGSAPEVIAKHLGATPPPLRAIVPDLPQDVEQVIMTALVKDPKARFGSVQAFATALEQASKEDRTQTASYAQETLPATRPAPEPAAAPAMLASTTTPETPAGRAQSHNPITPQVQAFAPYPPPYSVPEKQRASNGLFRQALFCFALLVAAGIVLVIGERIAFFLLLPPPAFGTPAYEIFSFSVFGITVLVEGIIDFFAGLRTGKKTGKVNLAIWVCVLANLAYLVLWLSYYIVTNYTILNNAFWQIFPLLLPDIGIVTVLPALILAVGVGALGGAIGRKQARKSA